MMATKKKAVVTRRTRVEQAKFPALPLNKSLRIAQALWDNFAGAGTAPHDIALALDMSPTSGPWRTLCGASSAYGLTKGSYASKEITLDEIGRKIVAPTAEGQDRIAQVEATLKPTIMKAFFEKYNRAKFPQDNVAANVLVQLGLPKDRADAAVAALKEGGKSVGIIRDTKTGLFVALELPKDSRQRAATSDDTPPGELEERRDPDQVTEDLLPPAPSPVETKNNKVYISHGKNRKVVDQIKELLTFGKLEPVVSVEREATAIPVPDKVFEDMRSCAASVIHIRNEGQLLDEKGNEHVHINDNVLIEIGAAIALHGKNVVLLVEKGLALPSNLQGLYKCEYEGEKLDYDATMKLLKTFNEFR